jgi:outer membrane protein TolC
MQLAMLEDKVRELEALRAPTVARLNAVLNPPQPIPLPWPIGGQRDVPDIDREELLAILVRENPRLQAKDFELLGAQSRIELAKKKFYPDLGIGVDWIETDGAIAPGVRDSGKDPVILMFTMNLPVWRKSYRGAEQQARARARRTQFERKDLENNLIAQAAGVLYAFEDSGRKITLYGDILVPKAEELVGASETAYTAGTIDFLSLIDAQQTLLQYQLLLERTRANRRQRLAELEMLVGADVPQVEPGG